MTPNTENMDRDEFTELFVDALKICKPKHPYYDIADPYKVLSKDKIKVGYCRSDTDYIARCGPLLQPHIATYSIDLTYFQNHSFEKCLATTTHELTHITVGTHRSDMSSTHPPVFWNKMAFNAQIVLDHLDYIESKWGSVDESEYKKHIINDPNSNMVDRRVETPQEVTNRIRNYLDEYERSNPTPQLKKTL